MPKPQKPKVLFVDDDPTLLDAMRRVLRQRFDVTPAVGAAEALEILEGGTQFSVIVSDMDMPSMNGVEFLSIVKEHWPEPTRIMLTGKLDQETAAAAVNTGRVSQFLSKPCSSEKMMAVLSKASLSFMEQQSQRDLLNRSIERTHALAEEIEFGKRFDQVTGLPKREDFILEANRRSQTTGHAICHITLNRFGVINRLCGRFTGDEFLRQLGQALQAKTDEGLFYSRLGGETFGVLIQHEDAADARRIAEQIREIIQSESVDWEDTTYSVDCNVGVVLMGNEGGIDAVACAELAADIAAEAGPGQIHITTTSNAQLLEKKGELNWLPKITDALKNDQFELFAQPIIPISDKSTHKQHYEVLLRLMDGLGGHVAPFKFLPVAEKYGLIVDIDRWVITHALDWLAEHTHNNPDLTLGINLSGQTMTNSSMLEFIINEIESRNVPPSSICFEVTETVAVSDLQVALAFMETIKSIGCTFALDDFGVGFASFGYLQSLPFDIIKIDGSFVKSLPDDNVSLVMVRAINEVAQALGRETVAEFVENDAILDCVRTLGVDYAQGYGIARPGQLKTILSQGNGLANTA